MTPSWYDVLGVEPGASDEEVRAAWRAEIADRDPGDRRFRLANQAAEVLLDPERRAAHDAELAAAEADEDVVDLRHDDPDVPDEPPVSRDQAEKAEKADETAGAAEDEGRATYAAQDDADADGSHEADDPATTTTSTGVRVGTGVLVAAVVVALALVVVTVLSLSIGGAATGTADGLPDAEGVAEARAAAEEAIVPIVSYDYRDLDASRADAVGYMTDAYRAQYEDYFDSAVAENAPRTETVVTASVVASGVARTGSDRVDVLLFFDRSTENKGSATTYRDQVTARMQSSDGGWLVECLVLSAGAPCPDDE